MFGIEHATKVSVRDSPLNFQPVTGQGHVLIYRLCIQHVPGAKDNILRLFSTVAANELRNDVIMEFS